jgi:hypothetical protein
MSTLTNQSINIICAGCLRRAICLGECANWLIIFDRCPQYPKGIEKKEEKK